MTVVSPLLNDRVANSVSEPGHTLTCAFNHKCRDYLAACQARTTGKDENKAIRHLFQRLAVLLVKGNAALLVNRVPSHPPPTVNGEL